MGAVVSHLALTLPSPQAVGDARRDDAADEYRNSKTFCLTTTGGERFGARLTQCNSPGGISSKLLVIYSHGNAEPMMGWDAMAQQLGLNVLSYEYPGYMLSTGSPTPANCIDAINATFAFALDKTSGLGLKRNQIVLFGRSLGSGPTVDLASREQGLAGLILQSALTSGIGTKAADCCACLLSCCDLFRNIRKIGRCDHAMPVLILHGEADQVVPFRNGKALYDRCPNPQRARFVPIPGRGHNDIAPATVHRHCKVFLHDFHNDADVEKAAAPSMLAEENLAARVATFQNWQHLKREGSSCSTGARAWRWLCENCFSLLLALSVVALEFYAWFQAQAPGPCQPLAKPHLVLACALLVWFLLLPGYSRSNAISGYAAWFCFCGLPIMATLFLAIWSIRSAAHDFFGGPVGGGGGGDGGCGLPLTLGRIVAITCAVVVTCCACWNCCTALCACVQQIVEHVPGAVRGSRRNRRPTSTPAGSKAEKRKAFENRNLNWEREQLLSPDSGASNTSTARPLLGPDAQVAADLLRAAEAADEGEGDGNTTAAGAGGASVVVEEETSTKKKDHSLRQRQRHQQAQQAGDGHGDGGW